MKGVPNIPGLRRNSPASLQAILDLEQRLECSLPLDYKQFLLVTDGFSLAGGLLMYSTKEIEERNTTYEVPLYAPGFLAIGGTGGGEAILVRQNDDAARLLIVDVGAMTSDKMRELAPTLEEWLEKGCELPED